MYEHTEMQIIQEIKVIFGSITAHFKCKIAMALHALLISVAFKKHLPKAGSLTVHLKLQRERCNSKTYSVILKS